MRESETRYRRSPHIVSYWADGRLVFHNFATGKRVAGTALTIGLLDYFDSWKPAEQLLKRSSLPSAQLRKAVATLVKASLLQQSGRPPNKTETSMEQWAEWNPAAGLLHFSTKDQPFEAGEARVQEFLSRRIASRPIPPATKTYPRRQSIPLPKDPAEDALSRVLLERRTWRRFGRQPLTLRALGTLMWLTFGSQKLMDLGGAGRAMLRTSPSAGARHPLEAYVVVRSVDSVAPGIYHYSPLDHRLARLKRGARSTIERHLPGQAWYGKASILVLITAVFARTAWKYPSPRAYRDVLLEAGHFCQTFCLIATALNLAPFCTGALADSLIERDLGLDGVTESVIYACGAGTRPHDTRWAPGPTPAEDPVLIP
jgi:SagB-type dehydrogenase family enzyme